MTGVRELAVGRAHLRDGAAHRDAAPGVSPRCSVAALLGAVLCLLALTASAAQAACPNEDVRVGLSAKLPDCRAYEKVTPGDKGTDTLSVVAGTAAYASSSGERIYGLVPGVLPGAHDGQATFVVSRRPTGWDMTFLAPDDDPTATHYWPHYWRGDVLAPDLSQLGMRVTHGGVFNTSPHGSLAFGPPGGPYTTLGSPPVIGNASNRVAGASSDWAHVLFTTVPGANFVPEAASQVDGIQLYEWSRGELSLVNQTAGGSLTSSCGAVLGNGHLSTGFDSSPNAVSSDGSRVFFESPDPGAAGSCPGEVPRLYVRENGMTTTEVSAPEAGVTDPNGPQPVTYVGAAQNGSKVFFVTTQQLTADDSTNDPELYEYDLDSHSLTRISKGASGTADGNVQYVLPSADGSSVYFVSGGQLTSDSPVPDGTQFSGNFNLYRYDTESGTTTYIAQVEAGSWWIGNLTPSGPAPSAGVNWYTTPDGGSLLFVSSNDLTGYGAAGGFHELYRYDAHGNRLDCVSCPPGDAPATGDAEFAKTYVDRAEVQQRGLSDDGSYVFFDTPDPLLPQDANAVRDVYAWHDGTLSLLSSGTDTRDSFFLGASASGSDAFLATHSVLVASDEDDLADFYDARVDGGFAPAATPPAPCSGESCQGALVGASPVPELGSVTFSGSGNVPSAPRPGRVRLLSRRTVRGTTFLLKVSVGGAGRVTIAGSGIRRTTRALSAAGTYRVRVALTRAAQAALVKHRQLRLSVHVRYAPALGPVSTGAFSVTVKPTVQRRHPTARKGGSK